MIETYFNEQWCKFFQFIQYFSLETSGILLSFACIDRYFTVINKPGSLISKLPFGTIKSSIIWCILLSFFIFSLNSLLFIDRIKYYDNKTFLIDNFTLIINLESGYDMETLITGFKLFPTWDKIHIILYPTVPVCIMFVFNILLIRKTLALYKNRNTNFKSIRNQQHCHISKKRNLTWSLLYITFLFIIMTMPSSVCYGFFNDYFNSTTSLQNIIVILDYLSFLNRSTLFFDCFLTNITFRKIVIKKLKRLYVIRSVNIDANKSFFSLSFSKESN
jgi:hypothetical protein